jgi:proteasome assembly chaperone (PAC2) family protein
MGIKLYKEPELEKPDMIACWPGIGNVGLISVDTLRGQIQAEELGEIEPWDFFYPRKVIIKAGVLEDLRFSRNKFYYKKLAKKDLIFFIAHEQPTEGGRMYAEGRKAYQMANLVLDVAERFGCQRVYTSGAAVAFTHHELKSRVRVVSSSQDLLKEVKNCTNTILMDEAEGKGNRGSITGLNGLLLGQAQKRGFEAICLMGEVPDYLSGAPFPYPRASKSVLEVLSSLLGIEVDYSAVDEMVLRVDDFIGDNYQKLPSEIKDRIEQRKLFSQPEPEAITEEDEKWMKEHIEELFKKGAEEDERPS